MLGIGIVIGAVFLILIGIVFFATRRDHPPTPQRVPEPPSPAELTDVIAPLPWLYGRPIRHRYDPEEFTESLSCLTCAQPILPQAEFWEVPLLNQGPDVLIAICLQCDSRSPYDKLEI